MPTQRTLVSATTIHGRIYVIGGVGPAGAAIAVFFEEVSGDELSEQAVKDTPPFVIMTNSMPQAHYPSMQQAPLMQAMQPYPFGGNQGQMPQMVAFPVQQMGTA